jgi:hypothetical protein
VRILLWAGILGGCAPGQIQAWGEKDALQSAWVHPTAQTLHGLLLSNRHLPCALNNHTDPSESLLEAQSLAHIYTQEGSRLIWVPLNKSLEALQNNPSIEALYFEVLESEVIWTDQLTAAYRATDTRDERFAGSLVLQLQGDKWKGDLSLDQGRLHANFRAQSCEAPELFQILGLLGID